MLPFLMVVHFIVCILLVAVVLLQFGKGAEVGAVMGGGASQQIFSSSQQGNIFSKITTVLAILFMVNSVVISSLTGRKAKESVFDGDSTSVELGEEAPAQDPASPVKKEAPAQ